MVDFGVTGTRRKALVKKLESLLGERAVYLGMPSTAFRIGPYEISKSGEVTGGELSDHIRAALARAGFVPVGETAEEAPEETSGLVFDIPLSELDGKEENFEHMVASKGELIKAAFGLSDLPMECSEGVLQILWFKDKEPDNRLIAERFISAMVAKAKQQKYVSPKPLDTSNEKYSFRVFLNSLGFIGAEHKQLRKELLKNLSGSSAWRNGKPQSGDA